MRQNVGLRELARLPGLPGEQRDSFAGAAVRDPVVAGDPQERDEVQSSVLLGTRSRLAGRLLHRARSRRN